MPKMVHLVYCDNTGKKGEKELDRILAGTKTMVVRGAAGRKIPHSRVFAGECLYFMEKGSALITAAAAVKEVQNFAKLSDREITQVLADNQGKLNLSEKQIERWHKRCLCLVEFEDVKEISPLAFDRRGHYGRLADHRKDRGCRGRYGIPYNYEKSKL